MMAGRSQRGFTIAELITVVAIVAILASVVVPTMSFGIRRQKEIELRERIRRITDAIDRYHELRGSQNQATQIKEPEGVSTRGWPKDLQSLTKPIELNNGKILRLLRERDLIDPMTGKSDWIQLSDNDDPDKQSGSGDNVFEVHSSSRALALDGKTHYNEW